MYAYSRLAVVLVSVSIYLHSTFPPQKKLAEKKKV
jgi:hypothetical protein